MTHNPVPVEQGDREAAAEYARLNFGARITKDVRKGVAFTQLSEAFARHRLATIASLPDVEGMRADWISNVREAGQFLLDRLDEHENEITSETDYSEWAGHVTPAIARFRAALAGVGE